MQDVLQKFQNHKKIYYSNAGGDIKISLENILKIK